MAIAQSKIAGAGRRTIGAIIDCMLLSMVFAVLGFYYGTTNSTGGIQITLEGMPAFIFFAIVLAYFIVLEGTSGRTLGKLAMGTRVVNNNGETISWGQSLVRNLMRIIDFLPFGYMIGFIVMVSSTNKQRVGDLAAKTYVIRNEA